MSDASPNRGEAHRRPQASPHRRQPDSDNDDDDAAAAAAARAKLAVVAPDDFDQFFVGTASLIRDLDKRVLVVLREPGVPSGVKFYGVLRSFDQFSNLVLQDCVERAFVGSEYAEKRRGLFVVRGENILFLSQLDAEKADVDASLRQIEWPELMKKRAKALKHSALVRRDTLADDD